MVTESENNAGNERYLLVGLGNPGRRYQENRHNLGFMLVDRLAAAAGIEVNKSKSKAIIGAGRIADQAVYLAKPQTYMNESGAAVGPLARYFRIEPANVLVAYDELDIPFGTLRLRPKGGAGGHNGMRSIIQQLGADFPRLRLGVGRPPGRMPPAAFVLQNFSVDEKIIVDEMLDLATRAVLAYLTDGIDLAMSHFNNVAAPSAVDV